MKQSKKEKKNEFRCMVCNQKKLRGVLAYVPRGQFKGCEVKICQSARCADLVKQGIFNSDGDQ